MRPTTGLRLSLKKFIEWPALRFLLASGANTLATYLLYLVFIQFMPYRIAYTLIYFFGILLAYLAQSIWVFRGKPSVKTAISFPVVYALQYFLGLFLLTLFVERAGIDRRFAPLLVICVTLPLMFLLTRTLFRKGAK